MLPILQDYISRPWSKTFSGQLCCLISKKFCLRLMLHNHMLKRTTIPAKHLMF